MANKRCASGLCAISRCLRSSLPPAICHQTVKDDGLEEEGQGGLVLEKMRLSMRE